MIVLFGVLNFADVIAITDMDHNFGEIFLPTGDRLDRVSDRLTLGQHCLAK